MSAQSFIDQSFPIRPAHVEQRHARIEMHRPFMLQRVAAYRFTAMEFESMIYGMPDNDAAIDECANRLATAQHAMVQAIQIYRQMRDIQGEG